MEKVRRKGDDKVSGSALPYPEHIYIWRMDSPESSYSVIADDLDRRLQERTVR